MSSEPPVARVVRDPPVLVLDMRNAVMQADGTWFLPLTKYDLAWLTRSATAKAAEELLRPQD